MVTLRKGRLTRPREPGFTDVSKLDLSGDDVDDTPRPKLRLRSKRARRDDSADDRDNLSPSEESAGSSGDVSDENETPHKSRYHLRQTRIAFNGYHTRARARASRSKQYSEDDSEDEMEDKESSSEDEIPILESDVLPGSRKRKRVAKPRGPRLVIRGMAYDNASKATRRSERSTRHLGKMTELGIDQIERSDSELTAGNAPAGPRPTGARESFQPLPRGSGFRTRHCDQCETCGNANSSSGTLIYCQGCSLAYHKTCIGSRNGRKHLVTKVGEGNFVLQCRRCVNYSRKKDHVTPDLARCQDCHKPGPACAPFRERKTMLQEQKEREDNEGEDPIMNVEPLLINRAENVMFRCLGCWRAFHFHHLPSRSQFMDIGGGQDDDEKAKQRFTEYSRDWRCMDCLNAPGKISTIVTWRPVDPETYIPGVQAELVDEDEKEYLIKWEGFSYFRAEWKPGPWVWGVAAASTRKSFFRKEGGPKTRMEDAIPEEFLRIDIVLDVRYTNVVDFCTEEIDRARIREVDQALIKYKGLNYEDAVWEKVPTPDDGDWTDFVAAYNDWVLGRYTHVPKLEPLKARLEKARSRPFTKLEKKKQPDNVVGGELMKYQVDGLNWLYFQWYSRSNGILADEMGLGKTIQIIAFLATMIHDHGCYPFLIVVPNSTVPNWRREIKQWAPHLRVVTYYGSAIARKMAYEYEMYPEHSRDLRCHVVVTSYEAAIDESCRRRFFKGVAWQGLIVDEGQRLKNDESMLYNSLSALKIPYRVLLTGKSLTVSSLRC